MTLIPSADTHLLTISFLLSIGQESNISLLLGTRPHLCSNKSIQWKLCNAWAKGTVDDSECGFIWLLNSLALSLPSFLREIFRITFIFVGSWEWNSWKKAKNSLKRHQCIRGRLFYVCVFSYFITEQCKHDFFAPSQQVFHPASFFGSRSGTFSATRGYPHLLSPFKGASVCLRLIQGDNVGKKLQQKTAVSLFSLPHIAHTYRCVSHTFTQISLVMYPNKIMHKHP